jgi:hypothetical protein
MTKSDLSRPARTSRPVGALMVGLIATAMVCAAHLAGLDHPGELFTLDLRFRHLSTAGPTADIVHVDIDDDSLQQAGRWPWPRTQIAGLADLLTRCGARTVAMDIEMPEPQELRFTSPAEIAADVEMAGSSDAGFHSAAEGDDWRLSAIINLIPPQFGDEDLADFLLSHQHDNIFLPMHIALPAPPPSPNDLTERICGLLSNSPATAPAASFSTIQNQLASPEPDKAQRTA